eukprot:1458033-Rhodomonas_salina.2
MPDFVGAVAQDPRWICEGEVFGVEQPKCVGAADLVADEEAAEKQEEHQGRCPEHHEQLAKRLASV